MRHVLFRFRKVGNEIKPFEPEVWAQVIAEWPEGVLYVELQDEKRMRSSQQNRYWWSVVLPIIGECWKKAKGWTLPPAAGVVHGALVRTLFGEIDTPLGPERRSSRDLTTAEFSQLIDWTREYARETYGVHIPEANES